MLSNTKLAEVLCLGGMVKLLHLRYFVAVADAGTVSAAADAVHVTQPALSRQLRQLENDLGVVLFRPKPWSPVTQPDGQCLAGPGSGPARGGRRAGANGDVSRARAH
jgi:hypothetical protein